MGQKKISNLHIVTDIKETVQNKAINTPDKMPRVCGPKLSNCCFVLSIWGIIMLILMGVFFRIEAVALLEDLPPPIDANDSIENRYKAASMNCFVAAGLYFVVFLFTSYQK